MARLAGSFVATLAVFAATLALPAVAPANLPVTKNHVIVPNLSLGGVRIGMKKPRAIAKWGSKPRCAPPDAGVEECFWEPPGSYGDGGYIQVRGGRVIVAGVAIDSSMGPSAVRALKRFKTAKGIHIGSSKSSARSAYPGLRVPIGDAGSPFLRMCHVNCTWFGGLGATVERISVAINSRQGYR